YGDVRRSVLEAWPSRGRVRPGMAEPEPQGRFSGVPREGHASNMLMCGALHATTLMGAWRRMETLGRGSASGHRVDLLALRRHHVRRQHVEVKHGRSAD